MKVTAVTAPDAASDPKHPDHDRWVKETTLAMEVRHAQIMGGTFRDAEAENIRLLERAEAIARETKPRETPKPKKKTKAEWAALDAEIARAKAVVMAEEAERATRKGPFNGRHAPWFSDREQRHFERGVSARHAAPAVHISKLSPCGRCGMCRNCKREKRVFLIIQNRKTDKLCESLADEMFLSALRINSGMGEFKFMTKAERDRAITVKAESVCDRSVKRFGGWQ